MSLYIGLYVKKVLDANEAVAAIATGGVFPVVAPDTESVSGDYVWFHATSCTDEATKDGWAGDEAAVEVECVARSYERLTDLASAVRAALYGAPAEVEGIPLRVCDVVFSAGEEMYDMVTDEYSRTLTFNFSTE